MNFRIVLAAGLLLTVGAAVPSSAVDAPETVQLAAEVSQSKALVNEALATEVTPEMIAEWRAAAATRGYIGSKRPI